MRTTTTTKWLNLLDGSVWSQAKKPWQHLRMVLLALALALPAAAQAENSDGALQACKAGDVAGMVEIIADDQADIHIQTLSEAMRIADLLIQKPDAQGELAGVLLQELEQLRSGSIQPVIGYLENAPIITWTNLEGAELCLFVRVKPMANPLISFETDGTLMMEFASAEPVIAQWPSAVLLRSPLN
jgi:hypothetical protein